MEYLVRRSTLNGSVRVSGAKNAALKLLAGSLLTTDPVHLSNFPVTLKDAQAQVEMLQLLGKSCSVEQETIRIVQREPPGARLEWNGRSVRTTLLLLGALVARWGHAEVPLPGGCQIGDRGYDLHEMVLRELGARVWQDEGYLCASARRGLRGAKIVLPIRSTGATENAILCGCLAKGRTVIWNPHVRPELINLVQMLRTMGASIEVHGQQRIEVVGTTELRGASATIINDSAEAMTWLIAGTITGGDIEIQGLPAADLEVPLIHLRESGARFYLGSSGVAVRGGDCYPVDIATGPYPGINSDMQPLFAVYAACAKGESRITDLRFPDRYQYLRELTRMGVRAEVKNGTIHIHGGRSLAGRRVQALDLRAGAALVLAGMVASGTTRIADAWQIERGYDRFLEKLKDLRGDIEAR